MVHGSVVLLGGLHHAGVLGGVEEGFAVAAEALQAAFEQGAQLLDHGVLAGLLAVQDVAPIQGGGVLPGLQAIVALARGLGGQRVGAL
ncbi:hypothetical protein D3C80_1484770 [compost metagenome]